MIKNNDEIKEFSDYQINFIKSSTVHIYAWWKFFQN